MKGVAALFVVSLALSPRAARAQAADDDRYLFLLAELLEYQVHGENPAAWELVGWWGGDYNRLWFKSEGQADTTTTAGDGDLQLLYGRLVSPFWDLQLGVRAETVYEGDDTTTRAFAVLGAEGLAPGWFDVDAAVFLSHEGDVSARATAAYNIYITQRLVTETRFELEAAVQEVMELGIGNGLTNFELGLRVRYELRRKLAPYVGITWERALFETADFARARGDEPGKFGAVGGLRLLL